MRVSTMDRDQYHGQGSLLNTAALCPDSLKEDWRGRVRNKRGEIDREREEEKIRERQRVSKDKRKTREKSRKTKNG